MLDRLILFHLGISITMHKGTNPEASLYVILLLSPQSALLRTTVMRDQVLHIQGVQGGKVNILGGHSVGHSKQNCI
jgi:hypothetical protein